jgi:hypothetical protein
MLIKLPLKGLKIAVFLLLCSDLLLRVVDAKLLYTTPAVKNESEPPAYFSRREIFPTTPQPTIERYLSLRARKPFALSEKYYFQEDTLSPWKQKRWNSFLLQKPYLELLHLNLTEGVLESLFAVKEDIFQWKTGIYYASPAELAQLPESFLKKNIVIFDKSLLPSIPKRFYKTNLLEIKEGLSEFTYQINSYEANSVTLSVKTAKEGLLYWSEGFDPDWKAFINGKSVQVIPAYGNFKAILLPGDLSHVEWKYEPVLFLIALFCFYFIPVGVLAGCLSLNLFAHLPRFFWDDIRNNGKRRLIRSGFIGSQRPI